ncbi:MAG: amidohydrolase [Deltaproteobacteria bacterium]|nr:amidohydrolase [Deltaproteobacteria bacterium]
MGEMEVKAIDSHIHLLDEKTLASKGERAQQMARYFGRERKPVSIDELADQYRARNMMAVIMNSTDQTVTGLTPVPNDHVVEAVRKHADVFLGFGVIDPWQGKVALNEIRRIKDLGLHGIGEINPARQQFFPSDTRFYPLWEEIQKQGLPILFHMGMAGAGAGTPGGMGFKLKYTQPIHLDDVAADFPQLTIIGAHPSWPWQEESLAICRHKANFFIDMSGWAPKYFPKEMVHYANTILQDKMLFGSDWPAIGVERWLEEFQELPIKPEVRQKILLENAKKLFKLNF